MLHYREVEKMKNKKQAILGIILCIVFSLAAIQHTQAAVKIFDETYVTDDPYIDIQYRIIVWSNQHVEVYSYYKHHSTNPNKCTFWYLAMMIGLRYGTIYYDDEITQTAPNVWEMAYIDGYGSLNQALWESGSALLNIAVQMKVTSYEYLTRWAVFRLVLTYSGWGFIADENILLKSTPAFPDYW